MVFLDAFTLNKPEIFIGNCASKLDEKTGKIIRVWPFFLRGNLCGSIDNAQGRKRHESADPTDPV
jgi:hypothetical protein